MVYQKMIIVIFSIISLTIHSCSKHKVTSIVKEGDYVISSEDYSFDSIGNLNFKCYYLNISGPDTPELIATVKYYYSTFDNANRTFFTT